MSARTPEPIKPAPEPHRGPVYMTEAEAAAFAVETAHDAKVSVRLARQNRAGAGVSFDQQGVSVEKLRGWLREIADALVAEPALASRNLRYIRQSLAPLVDNVLVVLDPDADEVAKMEALVSLVAKLGVKPDLRALKEFRRKVAYDIGTKSPALIDAEVPDRLEKFLREQLFPALHRVHHPRLDRLLVTNVETIEAEVKAGLLTETYVTLQGPGYRDKRGDVAGTDGLNLEVHGRQPSRPKLADSAEDWSGVIDFGAAPVGPEILGDADNEHEARLAKEQIEDMIIGEVDADRLRRALAPQMKQAFDRKLALLRGAAGTKAEREVGEAFWLHEGDVKAAAASFKPPKNEKTFRALLQNFRHRNPDGPVADLIGPRRQTTGRRRTPIDGPVHRSAVE